jgi:hypothetical protein
LFDILEAMGKNTMNKKNSKRGQRVQRSFGLVQTPHLRITLPLAQTGIITESAAGLGAFQTFVVNSAFDPYFTGGGVQPLGFDQYAQFYGRYRVLSARVEVQWVARSTSTEPVTVGMYASPQSTLPALSAAWLVQPTPSLCVSTLTGANGGPCSVTHSRRFKIADVLGVTSREFHDDQDFSAIFSASPPRPCYLQLFTRSLSGTAASSTYTFRIWMDIEFSQAVALSLS